MASKPSCTRSFSEQENLLLAELGRDFPEVEIPNGYHLKTLAKKTKAWEEILTKFNSQNLNGIKCDLSQLQGCWRRLKLKSKKEHDLHCRQARKTGGGSLRGRRRKGWRKSCCHVISASVNPLEQEFDDDAGEELDFNKAGRRRDGNYYVGSGAKSSC
ncbi:unnamed protein product [Porites lobata]|uniref:Myb/SANT-like DNA-binding domain-containing protein n=1 Tax=Porites lobata TaxID=104759 RepID=A0ABN8N0A2_9CNID|nr:unnamed protein product [Porites lobata]